MRQGHISTLHLWWARRPLVACRAAVFGALVPQGAASSDFVADLCTYPGPRDKIQEAQRLILQAHAERLTAERGEKVTTEDIEARRAPRPRVLDMFAGGGAIPLEALRLGCEAYALDLNPVAHLIELARTQSGKGEGHKVAIVSASAHRVLVPVLRTIDKIGRRAYNGVGQKKCPVRSGTPTGQDPRCQCGHPR